MELSFPPAGNGLGSTENSLIIEFMKNKTGL